MFSCALLHIVCVLSIVLLSVCTSWLPKCDLSEKDAPGKKKARKLITLKQKMDNLRRHDRRELTAAIRTALNLPESTLCTIKKDREITAAVKAGAGSRSIKVSSGQSNIMVCMEKMLVSSMDQRKHQGLNVTFDDTRRWPWIASAT